MKKYGKRILIGVIVFALVIGLAAGGIYWKKSAGGTVNVYNVQELAVTDYWGDSNESYGSVTTDQIQSVYLSATQTVKEVLVTEGQQVKKGDVLITYDTTLSEVEVQKKDLEIQQLELDLEKAKKNLEKVKRYRPGVPIKEKDLVDTGGSFASLAPLVEEPVQAASESDLFGNLWQASLSASGWKGFSRILLTGLGLGESSAEESTAMETLEEESATADVTKEEPASTEATKEEPTSAEATKEESTSTEATKEEPTSTETAEEPTTEPKPTEATTEEPETTAAEDDKGYPELVEGKGTKKKPYVYNWNEQCVYTQDFLKYISQGKKKAWVIIQVVKGTGEEAAVTSYWKIKVMKEKDGYAFEMLEICVDGMVLDLTEEEKEKEEDPAPDIPYDEPIYSGGVTYTAAEIAEIRNRIEEQIRDLDLNVRAAKVEYEKLKKELDNGAVLSEVDGVVVAVRDADESKINNQSMIDVSGGGGYYVDGSVSELKLQDVAVGQTVNVMSTETGMTYEGQVTKVSDYPAGSNYYGGAGNTNVSYYPFTVFIDESAQLQEGEFVQMTYTSANTPSSNFYLMNSMIRSENGSSYVYVKDADGKLKKQTVKTGKTIWGSYVEILSGVSLEDQIAFPYGTDLREGAATQEASVDALYNY